MYSSLMKSDSWYPLCSLCFMPDDVILTSILCPIYIVLVVMEHREVIGALGVLVDALVWYTLGSAGTRQQWVVAKC